ncbi:hypothetical protein [Bartonella rattaustraliani]|uniref:hypothetical protein n=1 Tax=Bartonella rattaustraliani TaxID=481139 RepID=UPI000377E802|nr:hypothetical protein [Bartonella rattaustraliani]
MGILTDILLTFTKKPAKKTFIATAIGHIPWGTGAQECFYNLYEYQDTNQSDQGYRDYDESCEQEILREYEIFEGGQYFDMPENVDFSTKAQVEAWLYGGPFPTSVLSYEPLTDEYNKTIKSKGQGTVVSDHKREVKKNYAHTKNSYQHPVDNSFSQANNTNLDPLDIMDEEIKNAVNNQIIKHKVRKK